MLNVVQWLLLLLRKNVCDKNNPIIQIAYVEYQSEYVRSSLFFPHLFVCLLVCYCLEFLLYNSCVCAFFFIRMSLTPIMNAARVLDEIIHNYEIYNGNNSVYETY